MQVNTTYRFHWPMHGPQALASTTPPNSRRVWAYTPAHSQQCCLQSLAIMRVHCYTSWNWLTMSSKWFINSILSLYLYKLPLNENVVNVLQKITFRWCDEYNLFLLLYAMLRMLNKDCKFEINLIYSIYKFELKFGIVTFGIPLPHWALLLQREALLSHNQCQHLRCSLFMTDCSVCHRQSCLLIHPLTPPFS